MINNIATYTAITEIEHDLDIDVFFLNSRIFTTTDLRIFNKFQKAGEGKKYDSPAKVVMNEIQRADIQGAERDSSLLVQDHRKYLCISIEIQIDDYESLSETGAYARPRLLIILDILSFLTQELFMPVDICTISTNMGTLQRTNNIKFKFKNSDHLSNLKKIIELITSYNENEKRLLYSLIDRYRKALYLEKESKENMIHDDEILLSYFHILELLSNNYYSQQKCLAIQSINQFTESILKNIFLIEGNQLQTEINMKRKFITNLFISDFPVGSKIMYMFQRQGMLTERLKAFISELIKDRNSVAHGRQVYQERVIFPAPQFFPLVRNRGYHFETLRILTGRAISLYININHLKEEWEEVYETLIPTFDELALFINEKKYEKITINDFYSGKENDITPCTIAHYLLNKKLKADKTVPVLSELILNYREVEDEIRQLVLSVILIVDNTVDELRKKCIKIIKLSSNNDWLPSFNMRDILYYLQYLGHQPKTLKEMITRKEIR
jgi:hypothetical protein